MIPKTIALITNPSVTSLVLFPGKYKFECWGAQGGTGLTNGVHKKAGGRGSYTSGVISIKSNQTFYLYVGGKGEDAYNITAAKGGFNGGGNGGVDPDDDDSGAGGGSSDIRLENGEWDNTQSLLSRIMVAAGGSGSVFNNYGAPGGDLNGYIAANYALDWNHSTTGQMSGYKPGIGENGRDHDNTPSSGAGGGYYGGIAVDGITKPTYLAISSSGSSYVSGYEGCQTHISGISFENPKILSGKDYFKSPYHKKEKGHEGEGAIKISSLDIFIRIQTCTLKYKRYFLILVAQSIVFMC